ncbi:YicC family protein [Rummeliibacillus sp. TYF005]|uniref:YicC/YloC family endoribonuclease n=1 Tax=unclassified Rummeliibacillus TaxID=2622809 RepID=UPI000E666493|nr:MULTISPECIES: YicC/YloC family endoribonuclease [unclassified Rummeliibacillus]RIJ69192.1 YicC family protein [Rummeliibacillus sp. POC4]RPJ96925.1 YicC family protein [Rummeliibacillus sp. TYF005]
MVRSMTGFGRGVTTTDQLQLTVEIRSVNHRFLEISTRFPKEWTEAEVFAKKVLSTKVSRGKLDVSVYVKELEPLGQTVKINWNLVNTYKEARDELRKQVPLDEKWSMSEILQLDQALILEMKQVSKEEILNAVEVAVEEAAQVLIQMRQREGQELLETILGFKKALKEQIVIIKEVSQQAVEKYRDKLIERIKEISQADYLEDRLLTEVAIFAEKADIAEELDRLASHLKQLDETLQEDTSIGRKLDFLMQEIHREINTIGSKNQSVDAANAVVQAKAIIEKMREQVQNIE